jgi:hypothetical protein
VRELTEAEAAAYAADVGENGYAIMGGATDRALAGEIRAELVRLARVQPGGDVLPAPFTGQVARRWFDLLNDENVWLQTAV